MSSDGWYRKIKENAAGFFIDKILSMAAGVSALVLGGVFIPLVDAVLSAYEPFDMFVWEYREYCFGVSIGTIVIWGAVWSSPRARFFVPYILGVLLVVVSGVMRDTDLLPTIVWVQFLLFLGGVLLVCEGVVIHLLMLVHDFVMRMKR